MKMKRIDQETWLEAGILALAAGLLGGLALLVYGQAVGSFKRGRYHRQGAPSIGSVPNERHQNIGANPAR